MPKSKHDDAMLRSWLAQARHSPQGIELVSATNADALSLRNALYYVASGTVRGGRGIRIERRGKRLTLRATAPPPTRRIIATRAKRARTKHPHAKVT